MAAHQEIPAGCRVSDSSHTSAVPIPRDVVDRYFDLGPYETIVQARGHFMMLALERACGMISERVFILSVLQSAGRNCFPPDDALPWAEHAYLTLRSALCRDGAEISESDASTEGGYNDPKQG